MNRGRLLRVTDAGSFQGRISWSKAPTYAYAWHETGQSRYSEKTEEKSRQVVRGRRDVVTSNDLDW